MTSPDRGGITSWRDAILREFATPHAARLTVAADPDGLLLEPGVLEAIEERGFELLTVEDSVAFRFAYETRYRSCWDRGERTDRAVVLRTAESDLSALPYDLLHAGRRVSFSLGDLFPNLSHAIVATLERSGLDALYRAQTGEPPTRPLGDGQTAEFVLRHVFGIAPETIGQESDLLRFLLRRHYRGLRIPAPLDDHLLRLLAGNAAFAAWPIREIMADREAFFTFLQERWPAFLDRRTASSAIGEAASSYGGPAAIPFDHADVRVYVDNLFLEGFLQPVAHPRADRLARSWEAAGVRTDPAADRQRRLTRLLQAIETERAVPAGTAPHREWLAFARRWAQVTALLFGHDGGGPRAGADLQAKYDGIRDRVDAAFTDWMAQHYGALHNQPPRPPVMIHHVPRMLARSLRETAGAKAALVLIDGLALDQWVTVRGVLAEQRPGFHFHDDESLFAWAPTLTTVSRQACFSGRPPLYFPSSIRTTDREPAAWRRFWADEGLPPAAAGYAKNLRAAGDLDRAAQLVLDPRIRAVALVVDAVDRIMHGMELGQSGMHNQIRQWARRGVLAGLIDLLLDGGFAVWLTSDHGNVEARGCGNPGEGAAAELRGQRVRVFSDPALRAQVAARFPGAVAWLPVGLPDDYLALIAPGRSAFVRPQEHPVAHGGITLDEVIVPLVRIERE